MHDTCVCMCVTILALRFTLDLEKTHTYLNFKIFNANVIKLIEFVVMLSVLFYFIFNFD